MKQAVRFHCENTDNFRGDEEMVRAFLYTDYAIKPHTHEFYEINLILSGKGTHCIDGQAFPVKSGHVFVIPPQCVHSYTDTQRLDVYHILIRPAFLRGYAAESETVSGFKLLMEIEPFLRCTARKELFLRLTQEQCIRAREELDSIADTSPTQYPRADPFKNHTLLRLLYWFAHLLAEQGKRAQTHVSNENEYAVVQALEYLHEQYASRMTTQTLYERVHLSRSTFLRAFAAICGCTPMQYLQNYRKKCALELLETSGQKKTAIAHQCGFYDLSHMERVLYGAKAKKP